MVDVEKVLTTWKHDNMSDDGTCAHCHEVMACDYGLEPTPMCNLCAQEAVPVLIETIEQLQAQLQVTEAQIDWWCELVHKHHNDWDKKNLAQIVQGIIAENEQLQSEIERLNGIIAVADDRLNEYREQVDRQTNTIKNLAADRK